LKTPKEKYHDQLYSLTYILSTTMVVTDDCSIDSDARSVSCYSSDNTAQNDFTVDDITGRSTNDENANNSNVDSPEVLVKSKNRAFFIVRSLLFAVLFSAAVGTSALVYIFAQNAEEKTFQTEYKAISEVMVGVLMDDMTRFLWTGKTAASALTIAMATSNVSPKALAILSQHWAQFTAGIIAPTGSPYVTWSPLIRTDNERAEFETFIMELEKKDISKVVGIRCARCALEKINDTSIHLKKLIFQELESSRAVSL
jgi:hypothetical protein